MILTTVFEMWSAWHFLFIFTPFIILAVLYEILRNRSEKTRYIVGCILGSLCLVVMAIRNINLVITEGFSHKVIPLQICHIANIVVFIACVFRSKTATSMAFVFHFLCALFSLIFADELAGFNTGDGVFGVTAMCYIFGHIFIIIGAVYPVLLKLVKFDFKDFWRGMGIIYGFVVLVCILNPYFNNVLHDETNWFFLYSYKGIPCKWLYYEEFTLHYGWFEINLIYVGALVFAFTLFALCFYFLQKLRYLHYPDLVTYNIFEARKIKTNLSLKDIEEKIDISQYVHEEEPKKDKELSFKLDNKTIHLTNKFIKLDDDFKNGK